MSFRQLILKTRLLLAQSLYELRAAGDHGHAARAVQISSLEERILLSAAPAAPVAEAMLAAATADGGDADGGQLQSDARLLDLLTDVVLPVRQGPTSHASPASDRGTDGPAYEAPESVHELVVIDGAINGIHDLLDELNIRLEFNVGRSVDVVVLDSATDGIDQITQLLNQYSVIDGLHVVTRTAGADPQLGSVLLNTESLRNHQDQIGRWQQSLTNDASIVIYGSGLSETTAGEQLLEELAWLTQTSVFTSEDLYASELQNQFTTAGSGNDVTSGIATLQLTTRAGGAAGAESLVSSVPRQIVFVDDAVSDYQSILNDIRGNSALTTLTDVYVLQSGRDGLVQISEILAQQTAPVDSIHFISHGTSQAVKLGSTWLTEAVLSVRSQEVQQWSAVLTESADILFYGCDVADVDSGQSFLQTLAELTGADIAASTNATGRAELGGDWVLEQQVGDVSTQVVVSAALRQNWNALLTSTPRVFGETGSVSLTSTFSTVNLNHTYSNAMVILGGLSYNDTDNATTLIANVTANSFQARVKEWPGFDGTHPAETVGYMVIEQGTHTLDNGAQIAAGTVSTGETWATVTFSAAFSTTPRIFASIGSANDPDTTSARVRNVTTTGFEVIVDTTENDSYTLPGPETLYWVALENAVSTTTGVNYEVGSGSQSANTSQANPWVSYSLSNTTDATRILLTDLQADNGSDTAELRYQNLTGTSLSLTIEEAIDESHAAETVAWAVFETGDLISYISPTGTAGDDILTANAANDLVQGLAGDDILDGAGGNDTIQGGSGYDTVVYDGNLSDYTLTDNGSGTITIVDNRSGSPDGTDTLTTIERLQFADIAFDINQLIVNTTSDVVDGNTTSIIALYDNLGADGKLSLREAMLAANNTANGSSPDRIEFNIPTSDTGYNKSGLGVFTIQPTSALPTITNAVIIDGTSQSQYLSSPVIEIDGSNAGANADGFSISSTGGGTTIRGFAINGYASGYGITATTAGLNDIEANYIG
ncbi:MAG: DUF4347 domain-containing protein, partial [Planctomycetaceae bacterium]|nr:DUF4347 domain-containing protein [Planctomycetaceae bacterium]